MVSIVDEQDESLLSRARGGDMDAFKVLVDRHEGKVAGIVKSMLGSTPEAMDVGQEVFIRFYESLEKFKGESALGTYLGRIAINLSLNELKRRKRRKVDVAIDDAKNLSTETSDPDLKEYVHAHLSKLDSEFRTVVTLRMIEGYSGEETAEILQVPLGTVLSRLSRAQKKLKEIFAKRMAI